MPPLAPFHILAYRADHRLSIPSLLMAKPAASRFRPRRDHPPLAVAYRPLAIFRPNSP